MRDWSKAMAALLAAVSSVGTVQMLSAQETTTPAAAAAEPVRAEEADPFSSLVPAAPIQAAGRDLTKEELQVTEEGTVELHVSDMNLLDVLRALSIQTRKNIIASKNVGGRVTADLYGVTVREALDAILHANGFAYREKGSFIYVYTIDELKKIEQDERKVTTQIFKLNYTPAAVALEMIAPALSDRAQTGVTRPAEVGLPTSSTADVGGNSHALTDALVITDYEDNMERIREILKEIDRRPQQILIEATILQAKLDDNNSLGVDFSLLGGVDFSSVGTTNMAALAGNSIPEGDGTLDAGQTTFDPITREAAFAENGYNAIGTNIKGPETQGLNIGIAYNNIGLFINALEQITDTVVLANPKVLTLNKQPGTVIVGRKDGYLTTTTTSTYTTQTVEYLETGTRLIFRPFIADDGYIRMEIHPEDSDGRVVNGLPFKQTTEVTTNVLVKDGHTIIIGGLFREGNSISKRQVPLLGDIPLAGYLFRQQADTSRRQEVIIMITPHIIKDNDMYAEASEEMLKYADMVRVGLRKGMMPWSRDRLAEMCYQKAREEMSQKYYDRDRALWYLDCATNLSPVFTEALAAKQRVSGELLLESDNSSIRHFLKQLVVEERVSEVPAEETPAVVAEPVDEAAKPEEQAEPETAEPAAPEAAPAPAPEAAPEAPAPAPEATNSGE